MAQRILQVLMEVGIEGQGRSDLFPVLFSTQGPPPILHYPHHLGF